ncbi:MAG: hypothetical protein KBT69_09590 [Oceanihabitans sp.]|nr:hypothetical protein [Oceanihabitans sp.]
MKNLNLCIITLLISLFIVSCESNPCDDGYTELDNGVCVPDYVAGIEKNNNLENVFYHSKYGAITFKNGNWYDTENLIIENKKLQF